MKENKSYAIALYQMYNESKNSNKFYDDIQALYFSINCNKEIINILSSKMLSKKERKNIIKNVFDKKIDQSIVYFLYVLVDNEFFKNIIYTLKFALKEIDHRRNQSFVKIDTAFELDKKTVDLIVKALKDKLKKEIDYALVVNPNLIGGVRIRVDDKEIDGTIEGKLKNMKKDINFKN
ncbi:MAG: ATP synthase F1 subunit delta [Mycoplasmoidaceae bacterium]